MIRPEVLDAMERSGALTSAWRASFEAVDRSRFLPDRVWVAPETGTRFEGCGFTLVERGRDARLWNEVVHGDFALVTQWDDGTDEDAAGDTSSSSSAPGIMALMLRHLDVEPGNTVYEAGTGTGYNAALLCTHLDDENVVSTEIDAKVAEAARANLTAAGFAPRLARVDSSLGWAERAPFDRLIATYAVRSIPAEWIGQVATGGVLVIPWRNHLRDQNLLRLVKHEDGTASGSFVDGCAFMIDRTQRCSYRELDHSTGYAEETTTVGPEWITAHPHANLYIATRVRECLTWQQLDGDRPFLAVEDYASGSWARVFIAVDAAGEWSVRQAGPRRLWDEVEEAVFAYFDQDDQPLASDWNVTVDARGHMRLSLTRRLLRCGVRRAGWLTAGPSSRGRPVRGARPRGAWSPAPP